MAPSRPSRFFFALTAAVLLAGTGAVPAPTQSPALPDSPPAIRQTKPDARRARRAYQKGLRAEQADNWYTALDAYAEAATFAPGDTEMLRRREAARFQIVQQHTDRAEREALAGRFDEASNELRAALKLDPNYSVARERLAQFAPPQKPQPAPSPASSVEGLPGPGHLEAQPGMRDFNHRGDTRSGYEEVARQFGVKASFDADLPSRAVRLRIKGVDFATAMTLVGQQTATFWRPVDAHTFFVAENAPQKRREYAPEVVRTIILPDSTTPEKMTEIARLVREIAGITHTDLDTRSRTLTLRDAPENVALAFALVEELEKAPAEFMLEIEILEVNRAVARRLGITPPSTTRVFTISSSDARAVAQAQNLSQILAIVQRIFGTTIPPVVAFGGGKTIFLATLPGGAVADFRETFTLVRSGRRTLLRAQDGQPATFFVGERFPVALATLGASLVQGQLSAGASQVAFPRSDFATGAGPVSVVTADFNGDGRLDLAIANTTDNTVSILLGNSDGTFQPRVDYKTGTQPVAVAVGDFNGDNHPDLVVANKGSDNVSILLNDGKGTFPTHVEFGTRTQPVAVAVGEFNADGHPDLAVANEGSNNVSVLLGNTTNDGTFKPHVDFAAGTQPSSIAIADFNADGHPDLAVANQGSNNVSILLGNTTNDGTFKPHVEFATGTKPVAVVTGDFDGDSRPDLAVANQTDNSVSLLLGRGDGTFIARRDFSVGSGPVALATADFNGDNRLDLAVGNQTSSTATLLLGNGDGTFGTRLDLSTGNAPSSLIAADFNGDARPDLAIANQNSNTVSVILNTAALLPGQRGIAQTAYPGAEYEDLGLKVRATPRVHAGSEVTLQLQFEIRSLSGVAINGIPVISNRTIEQTVRLRENETTVLSGIVQEDETKSLTGLPGFARATGVGHLAGRRDTQKTETELLIVLTPRRLRQVPRVNRSYYAGRGEATPGMVGRTPSQ